MAGVSASRILPTICIQSCKVAQVSLHAAWGKAGQMSGGRDGTSRSVGGMASRCEHDTSKLQSHFDTKICYSPRRMRSISEWSPLEIRGKMPAMNWRKQCAILIIGMATIGALAQSAPVKQATVCDIVNNPVQFEGKPVRVRAEVWSDMYDVHKFWMNEVTMRSGKVCHFLPGRFSGPTWFAGASGFGTFNGRIVRETAPLNSPFSNRRGRLVFLIEQESDIYKLQDMNGLVRPLRLYDKQTGSFIKAEQHTAHVAIRCGDARSVPGTSKMNVSCVETDLPANYDVWSTMIFQP